MISNNDIGHGDYLRHDGSGRGVGIVYGGGLTDGNGVGGNGFGGGSGNEGTIYGNGQSRQADYLSAVEERSL